MNKELRTTSLILMAGFVYFLLDLSGKAKLFTQFLITPVVMFVSLFIRVSQWEFFRRLYPDNRDLWSIVLRAVAFIILAFGLNMAWRLIKTKRNIQRAFVACGALVSLYLILLMGSCLITSVINVSHPLEGTMFVILPAVGSPLAFILTVAASCFSMKLEVKPWIKSFFRGLNIIGAIAAAVLSAILVILWLLGPMGPGD